MRDWEGRRLRRKTVSGGKEQHRKNREAQREEIKERREGWAHPLKVHPGGAVVCQRRTRAVRTGTISYLNPCYTSDHVLNQSTVGVSLLCSGPGSLKYWLLPSWPEIRLWMRPVSLSAACWGLKGTRAIRATQRPHSVPDSPQTCPSRQHKHPNVLNKVLWICISFPGPLDVVHSRIEKLLSAGGPSYQKRQMGASCQMWQKK